MIRFMTKEEREALAKNLEAAKTAEAEEKNRKILRQKEEISMVIEKPKPVEEKKIPGPEVPVRKTGRDQFEWAESEDTSVGQAAFSLPGRPRRDPLEAPDPKKQKTVELAMTWKNKLSTEMTERDWKIFREDSRIFVKGGRVPPPFRAWAEAPLPRDLLRAVTKAGYSKPTAVQMQAIPIALDCRDLIAVAETGSGKTAAFILPALTYIKSRPPAEAELGPYALVLAPTRELAIQIEAEAKKFSQFCPDLRTAVVVGGRSVQQQAFEISGGVELLIATPGRLADVLESRLLVLSQCFYVVLDEADRMITMGDEAFIHQVLDSIPASNLKSQDEAEACFQENQAKQGVHRFRITQMFSATMPTSVEKLARKYLRSPAFISVGELGSGKQSIEQRVIFVEEKNKKEFLRERLLRTPAPILIFANSKRACDLVGRWILEDGGRVMVLHSGKQQQQREEVMAAFKEKRIDILVATDVAGRGIDVEGVQHVINFDMPGSIEDYTHRIGRTGRAGRRGVATSFLTMQDEEIMYDLKNFLQSARAPVPLELEHAQAAQIKPGTADKKNIIY